MLYDDMPLLKSIKDYGKGKTLPLHMPGHKRGEIYKKLKLDMLFKNIMEMDTTEVPGVDNLFCPEGPLLKAQKLAAKSFGADNSFFLINGTTAGIYAMIMSVTKPGDKIIIPRNAHRSAISATILAKLHPVYILPEIDEQMGVAMGIRPETVERTITDHPDAKAVLITNPTYYGVCSHLEMIADIVHSHGKILLVDEAHGSHFTFHKDLPKSALASGADLVAQSTHKTLVSMTGSSMLHIKGDRVDMEKIKFFLQIVQTTSPSHVMLASLDAARYIMDRYGYILLDECIKYSNMVRDEINRKTKFYCLSYDKIGESGIFAIDSTRLSVCMKGSGLRGSEADKILRERHNIQVELSDINNIVAITTVADDDKAYFKFLEAIMKISSETIQLSGGTFEIKPPEYLPKKDLSPFEAVYKKTEFIDVGKSPGFVSGEMIMPYPPGIPVIMPGERISKDIIDFLLQCKDMGITISGMADPGFNKIKIIK